MIFLLGCLPTSLLPRGPRAKAEGLEHPENVLFASFGRGSQRMGAGSGEEADTQGCETERQRRLLDTCLTSGGLQSHCSRSPQVRPLSWFPCVLTPSPSRPHEHVLVLTAQQSLTQVSSHHTGGHSPERKFFCFLLLSQYRFNTIILFFQSLSPTLSRSCMTTFLLQFLFLEFQVRNLKEMLSSSLPFFVYPLC